MDTSLGFSRLEALIERRADATGGSLVACSDPFLERLLGLAFLPGPGWGDAALESPSCWVSRRRALYGDRSLGILGPGAGSSWRRW